MKKILLIVIVGVVVILGIIGLWVIRANNTINIKHEYATSKWANVQADYQRRKDLVEMAINVVKGAGNYEAGTLEAVINARNNAPKLNSEDLTEENIAKFQAAYDKMSQEMMRAINITVERYPELTATKSYQEFQAQIEGCENRINVSRKDFNEAVRDYNTKIRIFPYNVVAGLFGHQPMGYFQASEGADQAPSTEGLL